MSRVQPSMSRVPEPSAVSSVPIGKQVQRVLAVAYRARRPVLLEGPTGIGKSEIVEQFAAAEGIDYRVLDLSLLEPPDLVGLPHMLDGRTHYALPSELPTEGAGVLMLEELNRAEIPVMQPALQLLSARRLHSYELPPGWSCIAAVNPEQDDYAVNRLDLALRTRFLRLHVHATTDEWLRWAEQANVHPSVVTLVAQRADAFETVAPRSWAYAAEVLTHMSPAELRQRDLVLTLLRGYLPVAWATALTESLSELTELPKLDLTRCFSNEGAAYLQDLVAPLLAEGRTDAVAMLCSALQSADAPTDFSKEHWTQLAAALPGDLRERLLRAVQKAAAS